MRSVMNHSFAQVPKAEIQRSQFNRSHGYKTTFNAGDLVPVFVDEALPGDTFNLKMASFARMATPIVPIMDNLFFDVFFFAVPYRLVWDNWQRFNGEQTNPGDTTDFVVPYMLSPAVGGYGEGSVSDYFGIPTGVPGLKHSALFHRAYNLIWNEWFRDQNLQDSVPVPRDDGPDDVADYGILQRGKRHDYFTSCLPWAQKGDAVMLPLGESAPIELAMSAPYNSMTFYRQSDGAIIGDAPIKSDNDHGWLINGNNGQTGIIDLNGNYIADLSSATAATINSLRQAFQIQRLLERDARGGTRYTEIIRSHFGVVSPDARLQRPEYLGGGSTPISIHPIAQNSATQAGSTPQGTLAAMGVMSANGQGFTKSFTEHCLLIGLASVRADLNYQQGLNRMWSRESRWDFYWPALSHIGEQAVLNKEIYAVGTAGSTDDQVFGYQERYAEYRYKPSVITGKFRSSYAQSLDIWHLAQDFASLPTLGEDFIKENPPIDRVIAVPTEPQFLLDCYFDLKCARPMPTYSVPGMIDHF